MERSVSSFRLQSDISFHVLKKFFCESFHVACAQFHSISTSEMNETETKTKERKKNIELNTHFRWPSAKRCVRLYLADSDWLCCATKRKQCLQDQKHKPNLNVHCSGGQGGEMSFLGKTKRGMNRKKQKNKKIQMGVRSCLESFTFTSAPFSNRICTISSLSRSTVLHTRNAFNWKSQT